jgi:hypothetical protein
VATTTPVPAEIPGGRATPSSSPGATTSAPAPVATDPGPATSITDPDPTDPDPTDPEQTDPDPTDPDPTDLTNPTDSADDPDGATGATLPRTGGPGGQPGDDSRHGGDTTRTRPPGARGWGPDLILGSPVQVLRTAIATSAATAVEVARKPQIPLLLLVLVAAFLAVQDWIDRRDPKLALAAASQREAEITFPDPLGGGA